MAFTKLYEAVGVALDDSRQMATVRSRLFSLQEKGWVEYESIEDGSGGLVKITSEGVRVVEDRRQSIVIQEVRKDEGTTTEEVDTLESCPANLEELATRDQDYARLVRREELLSKIKEYFTSKGRHFIVLYGQPMVGKTKILAHLSETLGNQYIPLMVTGQGLNTVDNLDAFAFDLADQLTNKFRRWARRYGVSRSLNAPDWDNFVGGKATRAFYAHWNCLQQIADKRQPVVMFDEIEHLLDRHEELNPGIIPFLDDFVRNPENGYFIVAGSERIQFSSDKQFSMLIAKGQPIRVGHYDEATVLSFFSALQEYFGFEDDALQYCIALCDGHPRLLQFVFETIVRQVKSSGRRTLETDDIDQILAKVIEETHYFLWALWQRLSARERYLVWLIGQEVSGLTGESVHYLHELLDLAHQHCTDSTVDYSNLEEGVDHLKVREWTEWRDKDEGLFCLKLGIFPLWVRYCHIKFDEVIL
jgi:AAA+ ATPase superfamily predicted ATPase